MLVFVTQRLLKSCGDPTCKCMHRPNNAKADYLERRLCSFVACFADLSAEEIRCVFDDI